MPRLQGLDIRILLSLRQGFLPEWSEIIDADPDSAKAILYDLKMLLLNGYTTDNEYLQRLESTRDRINIFKQFNMVRRKTDDLVNTLLNDIKESINNTKQFPGYVQRFVKTEGQILTKRQVAAIELLTDSRFIKMSQYFSNRNIRYYEYFISKLYEVAESGDLAGEAQLLDALDKVALYGFGFLISQQRKDPKSKEIIQYIDDFKIMPGKLYLPGWLSSALAILLGGLSNFIMYLIFHNPIATLLASAYTRNTDLLITTLKYPVNLFIVPVLGAQFGWHNGLRSLFRQLQLLIPEYLNRFTFASLAIIGLAVASALLIAFFPRAMPFVLGLPALEFLASLSMPLLASVVGVTVGLVLLGIASLATVAMRPSKNKNGNDALQEGAAAKQSAADANDTVPPAVSPAAALAAAPSAGKTTLAAPDAADSVSNSKPLFSKAQEIPLQEGQVKVKLGHFQYPGYINKEQVLSKGETSKELLGLTVTYNQDGTFTIDLQDVVAFEMHKVHIGNREFVFKTGQPTEALPADVTLNVTYKAQPELAPQPKK